MVRSSPSLPSSPCLVSDWYLLNELGQSPNLRIYSPLSFFNAKAPMPTILGDDSWILCLQSPQRRYLSKVRMQILHTKLPTSANFLKTPLCVCSLPYRLRGPCKVVRVCSYPYTLERAWSNGRRRTQAAHGIGISVEQSWSLMCVKSSLMLSASKRQVPVASCSRWN